MLPRLSPCAGVNRHLPLVGASQALSLPGGVFRTVPIVYHGTSWYNAVTVTHARDASLPAIITAPASKLACMRGAHPPPGTCREARWRATGVSVVQPNLVPARVSLSFPTMPIAIAEYRHEVYENIDQCCAAPTCRSCPPAVPWAILLMNFLLTLSLAFPFWGSYVPPCPE